MNNLIVDKDEMKYFWKKIKMSNFFVFFILLNVWKNKIFENVLSNKFENFLKMKYDCFFEWKNWRVSEILMINKKRVFLVNYVIKI